ncbi:MAG TPA: glycine--tRNA ligase subunit beta, partial [Bellilinea sp.]|nr:glycine--tRNA ligase subunit beta [Bellilinea sp.]
MNQPLDFQTIIMTLQRYWAEQGCLIWQPYYTQVGAGTYNPATYLRVLGPEPWHVGYVEPSVRPDDGRYGENPNRLVQHTQFQVILKPDPGNPQEIYLRSLEALGIDPRQHDIRFVEDNWESPALGAWGLGWEVWLDGQEITQFTYFQMAGGIQLDPVSVEITYGLERIAMTLQRVRNFRDLRWSAERSYGDVQLQGEQEHSKYYFEIADVERTRQLYDLYKAEAEAALENHLVLPAHDYVLKMSHTFNILDTRGAIGVTERAAFFARMRDLSRKVAEAYLEQRTQLEFPWLSEVGGSAATAKPPAGVTVATVGPEPQDFFLEIGTEELPAGDLSSALEQLTERVPALLADLRLTHGSVTVQGTPRRLVMWVRQLASSQPDRESLVKGPPAARAYDAMGQLTPAAQGFARSKGIDPAQLQTAEVDGGSYVVAKVFESGRSAPAVLTEALPALIASIRFDKAMRWNASGVAFSRPIRWLTALFGKDVVPFSYAGLTAGRETRGLRFQTPETFAITSLGDYFKFLESQGILLDSEKRSAMIAEQVRGLISESGGDPQQVDASLLEEVTNLVEAPTALRGSFAAEHLQLPAEVLVSVMQKYQRYFPVYKADGGLLPYFIVVRNGDGQNLDVVADGNEQVVRARFVDAAFFIREDIKSKLEDFLPRLGTLTFQVKLGSMLDKTRRIEKLVEQLIPMVRLDAADIATVRRAATLCKADLVTQMVIEMTALQGSMGRYYARHSGESEAVANAIFEAYLPRTAGDKLPATPAGLLVGMADRLDTLAGLFAAGLAPTGTKDPFAQRRAALGLVQNLITWELNFDLEAGLQAAAQGLPIPASPESLVACLEFISGRLSNLLLEQGYRYDVVAAVLAEQGANPALAARAVKQLAQWVERSEWDTILPAYARCVRITRDQKQEYTIEPQTMVDEAEKKLLQAVLMAEAERRNPASVDELLGIFTPMIPVINHFFEVVLVMAEEPVVRANRLGLLQRVARLANGTADLSKLE